MITIAREHIGSFHCKDITTAIARTACNSISKDQYCGEFYLEIHKDADRYYSSFGTESDETAFKRLAYSEPITGLYPHLLLARYPPPTAAARLPL